jgi:organic hydroperoxide reductase OsmC/OhrA
MSQFPHQYTIEASGQVDGAIELGRSGLPKLESLPPVEFGGPGDHWSPEDLLMAAVADCFILSFRAIAAASKFAWESLKCEATGKLDRVDRKVCFTELRLHAQLVIPGDSSADRAKHLLEKAEQTCFITNSLSATKQLEVDVQTSG